MWKWLTLAVPASCQQFAGVVDNIPGLTQKGKILDSWIAHESTEMKTFLNTSDESKDQGAPDAYLRPKLQMEPGAPIEYTCYSLRDPSNKQLSLSAGGVESFVGFGIVSCFIYCP